MKAILLFFSSIRGVFVPVEYRKNSLYSDLFLKLKHPEYLTSAQDKINLQNDVKNVLLDLDKVYKDRVSEFCKL